MTYAYGRNGQYFKLLITILYGGLVVIITVIDDGCELIQSYVLVQLIKQNYTENARLSHRAL